MNETWAIDLARESIKTMILIGGPMMVIALVVGLLVSVFQALTQINEATLSFIPKVLSICACLVILGPWMIRVLVTFTQNLFENMNLHVR